MNHLKFFAFIFFLTLYPLCHGQGWPNKPIKIIAPSTPGGPPDVYARAIADHLSKVLSQAVVVENIPAAGGMIAAQSIMKGASDGSLLLVNTAGMMTITPSANPNAKYHAEDFSQICQGVSASLILAAHPSLGIKSFSDLTKWLKSQKVQPTYSSYSMGSPAHLLGFQMSELLGVEMTHVPYKSTPQQLTDMVAGVAPLGFVQLATASPNVKAGKLIALAVTSESRSADLPQVPTVSELGYPQMQTTVWFGLSGPKNLSPVIVKRLIELHQQMSANTEFDARMSNAGLVVTKNICGDVFTKKIMTETESWAKVIKAAGFVAEN